MNSSDQAAALAGFKVYKWNERLPIYNVSAHQGLFVIRRAEDKLVQCVLPFNLDDLVMHPLDIDGYFAPHPEGHTFFMALANSMLFEQLVVTELAKEINSFLLSCFRFEEYTICCYPSPRFVFVADISNSEAWRSGNALLGVVGDVWEDDGPGRMFGHFDFDMEGDVVKIVQELRKFCNATRTFPLEPLSLDEPLGLIEEEKNLDIRVLKESEEASVCSICLDPMAEDKVVLETRCGHVYHMKCSLPWFSSEFNCPLCRAGTISII